MKCPSCGVEGRVLFGWVRDHDDGLFFEHLICHACDHEFEGDQLEPDDPTVQGHLASIEEAELLQKIYLRSANESGGSFDMKDALALVDGEGQIIALIDYVLLPRLVQWAKEVPYPPCTNVLNPDETLEDAMKRTHSWWVNALRRD